MSDFDWRIFDRMHPSSHSTTAALTAPRLGRTRPALKWAVAVGTLTAAAAVALLIAFGPFKRTNAPPMEGALPAGEKIVAKMGDYPITDREMTAYMMNQVFADSSPGTCDAAAAAIVRSKIAREEIEGTEYDHIAELEEEAAQYAQNAYEERDTLQGFCSGAGISREEYIDCIRSDLINKRVGIWHYKQYCAARGLDETPWTEAEYDRYMQERISQLEFHPIDDVFLTEVKMRMREISNRIIADPDPIRLAEDLFNQACAKLYGEKYAEAQAAFEQLEDQYPGQTQAAAYAQFCLALRIWNGDTSAHRDALDLTAALPAVCLVTDQAENGYGLWAREKDGALVSLASISKNDASPTFTVEGDKLMAYGYEVRFRSTRSLSLIGEGEMAGDYVPYADPQPVPVAVDRITIVHTDILDQAAVWPYGNVIYRNDQLKKWLEEIEEWSTYAVDRQEGDHPSLRQQMESYSDAFFDSNLLLVAVVRGNGEPQVEQVTRRNDRFTVDLVPYEYGDQGYFLFIEADIICSGVSEVEITPGTLTADHGDHLYQVRVTGSHAAECEVYPEYEAGEEVTVKLPTVTEHDYVLYVNGSELHQDRSDMEYTYFRFTMPEKDVLIRIEDRDVDIPDYQGMLPQVPQGEIAAITVSSLPEAYEYRFTAPEDTAQIRDYFNGLHLSADYPEDPNVDGMVWVTEIAFANGDAITLYHSGNMFIRNGAGPWYKMEYEEAAAYAGLLDRLAIDCEMPSADELLNLEVADHRLVFQRIAVTPAIVCSEAPLSDMGLGIRPKDPHGVLNAFFRGMNGKEILPDMPECDYSRYVYMFDEEGAASWRYRFALCECGTVEVRKGDGLLCCIKITEEEMDSILSILP